MTDEELLKEVKTRIGATGDFQDGIIKGYIEDVKFFMLDAGVSEEKLSTRAVIGVITRGVNDLWNNGSGNATLSPYFKERVVQLRAGG